MDPYGVADGIETRQQCYATLQRLWQLWRWWWKTPNGETRSSKFEV